MISNEGTSTVPAQLLDPKQFDDPMFKEAAITVRLTQGDWGHEEVTSLAKHAAELAIHRPQIIETALEMLSRPSVPQSITNQLDCCDLPFLTFV